jgi:hypothetical protein
MTNVHHIAGLDDRERGFNRQAQVIAKGSAYQARLRYEALQIEVETAETEEEALQRLIHLLQERGYSQLRTQRIFQGQQYLGNEELWVEYPDNSRCAPSLLVHANTRVLGDREAVKWKK